VTARTKAAEGKAALKVTAPLVQVTVGDRVLHYHLGDTLPDGVAEDSIDHLKSLGFIAEA